MQDRVIFMGTPDFAVPALRVLADRLPHESLLVVTQPDRKAGRGRKLQPPAAKAEAEREGLACLQVETLRDQAVRDRLESFSPTMIVVAAFGRILPKWVLRLPPRGCVNLHASILPRFRGASPIAAAIACGDEAAGVALMEMEPGLDTGGVFANVRLPVDDADTTESLTARLAEAGAGLLDEHLDALLGGSLAPVPQQGQILETRKIVKAHGMIDWSQGSKVIERHVRAMWPWPRAWTIAATDARLQVHRVDVVDGVPHEVPGTIVEKDDTGVLVTTGDGLIRLVIVQLPGKQPQQAARLHQHPALAKGVRFAREAHEEVEPWIVEAGWA